MSLVSLVKFISGEPVGTESLETDKSSSAEETIEFWKMFSQKNLDQINIQRTTLETNKLIYLLEDASPATLKHISKKVEEFLTSSDGKHFQHKLYKTIQDNEVNLFRSLWDVMKFFRTSKEAEAQQTSSLLESILIFRIKDLHTNILKNGYTKQDIIELIKSESKNLKTINLIKKFFDKEVIAEINKLENLEGLSLAYCKDFNDLKTLGGLKKLKSLNLQGTSIASLDDLCLFKDLERIDLSGCKELTKINPLTTHPSLKFLSLVCSYMNETTLEAISGGNVEFQGTSSSSQGVPTFVINAVPGALKFPHCFQITDNRLKLIGKMQNLEGLILETWEKITDKGIKYLENLKKIKCLDLSMLPKITDEAIISICKLENLEELVMCNTPITDKNLEKLQDLKHLKYLSFADCPFITDRGLEKISRIPSLVGFNLSQTYPQNKISQNGLIHLRNNAKKLQYLSLDQTGVNDQDQNIVFGKVFPKCEHFPLMSTFD